MRTTEAVPVRNGVPAAALLAALAHLALDYATSRVAWTTPPYLLLDHARGPFRDLLQIAPGAILAGASIASSGVNGVVAAIFGYALQERRRRLASLGLLLSGLWIMSGGLLALLYLSVPPGLLAGSLLAGVPRSFAIAWIVDRVLPRPER
ncbi:MAG TPA: hypothetical protein VM753_20110 [Anaeromyxobacter sp.]|jgi:hypothetical protein|nr:hypothetical protein [Anaeromyxobacter sp.]